MIDYFVFTYGNQILMVCLCAIFGSIGWAAKKLARRWLDTQDKQAVARNVVLFVEQVWKDFHGEEKLQRALEKAQEVLAAKGIDFDAAEMELLIEAAVAEFNEAFKKPAYGEPQISE